MRVDVISDFVCPWCYVGKRRLERVLERNGDLQPVVNWRAFQLNSGIPPGGVDRALYLARKFGDSTRIAKMQGHVEAVGRELGISFALERIERVPNSLNAHRLVRWASGQGGDSGELVEMLFRSYFEEGLDIGELRVLCEVAQAAGLSRVEARRFLLSDAERAPLMAEDREMKRSGIQGVPCFIFEGRYALSGAQPAEAFDPILDIIRQGSPAPAFPSAL